MKRFLKKHFLPHKSNGYRPHFFRAPAVVVMLVILVGGAFFFSRILVGLEKTGSYAAVYSGVVIAYTNQNREQAGDGDLAQNALLTKAAQMKADDMAAKGYFAHNSPDGKTSWYWFDQVGYKYEYAGENLAINFDDSEDVTNAWMASPTHRANMLYPHFTEIGVATAVGMYQGRETTFVVQMFGMPKTAQTVSSNPPKESPVISLAATTSAPTTVVATASEQRVEGAYTADVSIVDRVTSSPRKSVAYLYYAFIALVAGLLIFGAAIEWKRHHRSMWVSAGILILIATVAAVLIVHGGQGIVSS
jgi:hypothetical protein